MSTIILLLACDDSITETTGDAISVILNGCLNQSRNCEARLVLPRLVVGRFLLVRSKYSKLKNQQACPNQLVIRIRNKYKTGGKRDDITKFYDSLPSAFLYRSSKAVLSLKAL